MAKKTKEVQTERKAEGQEKYLYDIFTMLKRMEHLVLADKETRLTNTEIRLISEVLAAKYVGKRLISTQLAKLLGVTRSAVSQIVNRMEEEGILKRVPDPIDKKIAYIEVTGETMDTYSADLQIGINFLDRVVKKMGEKNFTDMCGLFNEFCTIVEEERAAKNKQTIAGA